MDRRRFLKQGTAWIAAGAVARRASPLPSAEGQIMTVRGPIAPEAAGIMLPHEHLMSTFGAEPARQPRYDEADLLQAVLPRLRALKRLGAGTVADATAAYFGRDPALLRRLSERSGLHLLTNTGYYGAADDRYVPAHAHEETADELAARWLGEWRHGIGGTDVRPGFVKIGVDAGPLSDVDRELVRAAARLHLASGLTLAVHTGDNAEAVAEQLAVLEEEGVAPGAWIWVHANKVARAEALLPAARAGAWLSLDGLEAEAVPHHLALVQAMKEAGFLGQVLLSHDGNSYRAGGRPPRPYEALFTRFLPALLEAGFTTAEVRTLTVENPARAFGVRVRTSR